MASLKDNLLLKEEALKVSLAETQFSFFRFLSGFPRGKKILLIVLAIGLIPAVALSWLGTKLITQKRLEAYLIAAHPAYVSPKGPSVGAVKVFNSNHGYYSAYAQVANDNLDLAASSIPYHFDFMNGRGELVTTITGTLYLLPNQKKYVVAPRVDSKDSIVSAQLVLGEVQWQKRLSIPEVSLRAAAPFISNETDPLTLIAEGAVVNDSPYELSAIRLVFLLYNNSNEIVGVSQRDEFSVPAFGRRAYKQTWPDFYANDISRVQVLPDTNTLDNNNLLPAK